MSSSSRKRRRSSGEDSEECLPISKRINGLHIRYSTDDSGDGTSLQMKESESTFTNNGQPIGFNQEGGASGVSLLAHCEVHQACLPQRQHAFSGNAGISIISGSQHSPADMSNCQNDVIHSHEGRALQRQYPSESCADFNYEPDLSEFENPHYYETNKLLFDAHMLRTQRRNASP